MILIPCPHCGPRNSSEFRQTGESAARPDPNTATPQQWRSYLYDKENSADWVTEGWYHGFGCRRFITIARHRTTNETRPARTDAGGDLTATAAASERQPAPEGGDHADATGTTTGRML